MQSLRSLRKMAAPLLPRSVKRAFVDALVHDRPSDDVAFRPASPASPPEIARSIFDLHEAGLLEGRSYYEFGLFRGFAFWFAHQMIRKMGVKDFHCHGFDSFEGFPDVDGGGDEGAPWTPGTMACSREQVEAYLREFDADMTKISLHAGWFSDELFAGFERESSFGEASLVMLDCDFYASTVPVLRFIRDKLVDGTILLFDDYNCFDADDERGQRLALREFLEANPGISIEPLRAFGWHGQGFRVHLAGAA